MDENKVDDGVLRVNEDSKEVSPPQEVDTMDTASNSPEPEAPDEPKSTIDESVARMELAADYAKQDADDINRAKRIAQASERHSTQPSTRIMNILT